jgi:transcriptional regulator with XRE-family HTH domain
LGFGLGEKETDGPAATTDGMGVRLSTVRVEQGLTKAALSRLANLSPSSYAKIENGGQTGVDVLEALAKALKISPAWLAFGFGPQVLPSRRGSRSAAHA